MTILNVTHNTIKLYSLRKNGDNMSNSKHPFDNDIDEKQPVGVDFSFIILGVH
jgi:hypothetical protein